MLRSGVLTWLDSIVVNLHIHTVRGKAWLKQPGRSVSSSRLGLSSILCLSLRTLILQFMTWYPAKLEASADR